VSKAKADSDGGDRPRKDHRPAEAGQRQAGGGTRRGFFDVYKPGQGFHTRVWSGVAAGALVLWFAFFLYEKLGAVATDARTARLWQVGTLVAVIVIFGLLGYWILALNRKVCDFLIATEGEMKKVNWSSRKDIIGSTKVVVLMVLFMGSLLFVVDLTFMTFFNSIGVLKGAGFLDSLREMF
jgi:preprotein translocase SecE subunit